MRAIQEFLHSKEFREHCIQRNRGRLPTTFFNLVPIDEIAQGELHENGVRKDFTPTESVAIAEAVRPLEKEKAKERR